MTELELQIQSLFGLDKNQLEMVGSLFKATTLPRGEFFIKAGRYSPRLAFMKTGLIREFTERNGKEVTKWIATESTFITELNCLIFNKPARWNFQALTNCELFEITDTDYKNLHNRIPQWHNLERLFIAKCFMIMEERFVNQLALNAEERYTQLFKHNKDLLNTVPLQYLASMLGMTPETFSRVRRKLMQER